MKDLQIYSLKKAMEKLKLNPGPVLDVGCRDNSLKPLFESKGFKWTGCDLVIDEDSTELIKELNNYCWLEKKSQTPCDNWNHCLDALRYAISYQLQNPNSGEYFLY